MQCKMCEREKHSGHFGTYSNLKLLKICDECEPSKPIDEDSIEEIALKSARIVVDEKLNSLNAKITWS